MATSSFRCINDFEQRINKSTKLQRIFSRVTLDNAVMCWISKTQHDSSTDMAKPLVLIRVVRQFKHALGNVCVDRFIHQLNPYFACEL